MSETPLRCSQCGKEALDPYCIENCPKHLCEECGEKCSENRSDNIDEWPDPDKCEECPYEPDDNYDPGLDEPTPEEIQESIDEADPGYEEEEDLV